MHVHNTAATEPASSDFGRRESNEGNVFVSHPTRTRSSDVPKVEATDVDTVDDLVRGFAATAQCDDLGLVTGVARRSSLTLDAWLAKRIVRMHDHAHLWPGRGPGPAFSRGGRSSLRVHRFRR